MADGSARPRTHEQRIAIAVDTDVLEIERMPRGFTFFPEPPLAAAEEHDAPIGQCGEQRPAIHVAEHQDCATAGMLHDGWEESAAFCEVQSAAVSQAKNVAYHTQPASRSVGLTGIPAYLSSRLSSGIRRLPE